MSADKRCVHGKKLYEVGIISGGSYWRHESDDARCEPIAQRETEICEDCGVEDTPAATPYCGDSRRWHKWKKAAQPVVPPIDATGETKCDNCGQTNLLGHNMFDSCVKDGNLLGTKWKPHQPTQAGDYPCNTGGPPMTYEDAAPQPVAATTNRNCGFAKAMGNGIVQHCTFLKGHVGLPHSYDPQPVAPVEASGGIPDDIDQHLRYAEQLAVHIAARCYPDVPQFKPLTGDLFGLLTQIDNMTTGMVRSLHLAPRAALAETGGKKGMSAWSTIAVQTCGRGHQYSGIVTDDKARGELMLAFPKPRDSQTFPETAANKIAIRQRVFNRDEGRCVDCGRPVILKRGEWNSMHLMHLKSKGSGGDWSMENLETGCLECHGKRHNAGGKPVPRKHAQTT